MACNFEGVLRKTVWIKDENLSSFWIQMGMGLLLLQICDVIKGWSSYRSLFLTEIHDFRAVSTRQSVGHFIHILNPKNSNFYPKKTIFLPPKKFINIFRLFPHSGSQTHSSCLRYSGPSARRWRSTRGRRRRTRARTQTSARNFFWQMMGTQNPAMGRFNSIKFVIVTRLGSLI